MKQQQQANILISSTSTADIHYLCACEPPEYALFVQENRRRTLIVSEMEYNRLSCSVKKDVKIYHPAQIGSSWKEGPVDWIRKTVSTRKINVPPEFPFGLAEKLIRTGFTVRVSGKTFCPQRETKTPEEIKAVQQSQRAAVAAMRVAIAQISSAQIGRQNILREGKKTLTSEAVRRTIARTMLDHDCTAAETIVACGPASADPHERGEGPLIAGQPIVLDIFPRSGKTGYWGDITRTVCRGPAPDALKKQYAAVKAAQAAQLKVLKGGVYADTIHKIGADLMKARGFKTGTVDGRPQGFIHGTGHGVGLEIHEAPRVSAANHQKLRAGHIITIEPGLYYPGTGGVRIEDTVLVTKDGYTMLASCLKQLEI